MDIYSFPYEIWYIMSPFGSIELKHAECTEGGMVNIHTKFEVNWRKIYFS